MPARRRPWLGGRRAPARGGCRSVGSPRTSPTRTPSPHCSSPGSGDCPDARLTIVGGPIEQHYSGALRRFAADLGLAGAVEFVTRLTPGQLASRYAAADVLVMLSEHEGFGVPLVEAMSHGLPIVAFDSGAVAEILGGAGVLLSEKGPPPGRGRREHPPGRRRGPHGFGGRRTSPAQRPGPRACRIRPGAPPCEVAEGNRWFRPDPFRPARCVPADNPATRLIPHGFPIRHVPCRPVRRFLGSGRNEVRRRCRTRFRHLPAPAEGAHRLHRFGHRPGHGQPGLLAADPARGREPGAGHLGLHQLARRLGHRRPGHLRHDAVRAVRRPHHLRRAGRIDGPVPALRRHAGQAVRPAPQPHPDAPAVRRHAGTGLGHRHPGRADHLPEAHAGRADRLPHRPAGGADRGRLRP